MAIVSAIAVYPVKSLQGITLSEAELTTRGIRFDRQWMITGQNGRFLSQREYPQMAGIRVVLGEDTLELQKSGLSPLKIPLERTFGKTEEVIIWKDTCRAYDEGEEASEWLSKALEVNSGKLTLCRFAEDYPRQVDPDYMGDDYAETFFSDGFPFLITTESSLDYLNKELMNNGAEPVPMSRFRANIVLSGTGPFAENRITEIRSSDGKFGFRLRKPCKRCSVTTVDQQSGTIGNVKEPLRTLSKIDQPEGLNGAYFGQNATLELGANKKIRVGDVVVLG